MLIVAGGFVLWIVLHCFIVQGCALIGRREFQAEAV